MQIPPVPEELPPLAVRIANAPPAAAAAPAPGARPRQKRVARAPSRLPLVPAPSPLVVPREPESNAADSVTAEAPPPPAEPAISVKAEPSTFVPEAEPGPVRTLPRKGRITYDIVYGRDKFPVGRNIQSWDSDGTRYRIASRSETTGLVDLFFSRHHTSFSTGTLTREGGLRPETFLMSRNRGRGAEEARVQFDWAAGSVILGRATAQRREPLPQGSQDLVSFMYQLSLDPPRPGRFHLPITNGSRLESYTLDVLPEETIDTPLGTLRALPIKQVRAAGKESVEVWLATEYRHLPVRIRYYNREGEPAGEAIISEIRVSEE